MPSTTEYERLSLRQDGKTLIVTLNTGHKANAFCFESMQELTTLALDIGDDESIAAVVLTGSDGMFSSGMNLSDPRITDPFSQDLAQRRRNALLGAKMCRAWESIGAVTFAAIEGASVGGGVALALALDFRVCAKNSILFVPEVERGMNMSWQSVPRSVALIGPAKTKRMFLIAEKISGETAHDWGWADYLCEPNSALATAQALAKGLESKPPMSLRMCKEAINVASQSLNHAVSFMDSDQLLVSQHSDDYREGIHSYLEKREPRYTGK